MGKVTSEKGDEQVRKGNRNLRVKSRLFKVYQTSTALKFRAQKYIKCHIVPGTMGLWSSESRRILCNASLKYQASSATAVHMVLLKTYIRRQFPN